MGILKEATGVVWMATTADFEHGSRTTVAGSDIGLPFIELVGRTESSHARFPLGEHDHGAAYEICYLKRGSQTFTIGSDSFTIHGGEDFIAYPWERHGTGHEPLGKSILYWTILDPSAAGGGTAGDTRAGNGVAAATVHVLRAIQDAGIRCARTSEAVDRFFELILDSWDSDYPVRDAAIQNAILSVTLDLYRVGTEAPEASLSEEIASVAEWIETHPSCRPTIAAMAEIAGLSESHFRSRFEAELGMPPAEYAMRVRVGLAEQALAGGTAVTDVAFDLGFISSQYFATVFKQFTGRRPSDVWKMPQRNLR